MIANQNINDWVTDVINSNDSSSLYRSNPADTGLPEPLQNLMREFSPFMNNERFVVGFMTELEEINYEAERLSGLYHDEQVAGTVPYYVYYIANRIALDVRSIIQRENNRMTTESTSPTELDPEEDEPVFQFPQTREEMTDYMSAMEHDSNNLWGYSDLIPDGVYHNLPEQLREYLDELTNLLGLGFYNPYNLNHTIERIRGNARLNKRFMDICNRVKGYLYNGKCYSDIYLGAYILRQIYRMLE